MIYIRDLIKLAPKFLRGGSMKNEYRERGYFVIKARHNHLSYSYDMTDISIFIGGRGDEDGQEIPICDYLESLENKIEYLEREIMELKNENT